MPDDTTILGRFLDADGHLITMPAKRHPRLVVLRHCADRIEPGVELEESEVNARLRPFSDDVAMLRRYLVDEGMIERRPPGIYRRSLG
ncbi:MAG TPA: DUF2087 domain-containing protein [Nocardioidaceae bacterium]|jgi:hypothetical protein